MVRAVRAGASWLHFDVLQCRRVRRSRARLRYFEGPRVCRHVILSRVLRTLPWWLKDPAQPRASAREQGTMPGYPGREPSPISQTWRSVKTHFGDAPPPPPGSRAASAAWGCEMPTKRPRLNEHESDSPRGSESPAIDQKSMNRRISRLARRCILETLVKCAASESRILACQ